MTGNYSVQGGLNAGSQCNLLNAGMQQKVSVVGCVVCDELQWESSSKTCTDLLTGGAGTSGQGHRHCTSSS